MDKAFLMPPTVRSAEANFTLLHILTFYMYTVAYISFERIILTMSTANTDWLMAAMFYI